MYSKLNTKGLMFPFLNGEMPRPETLDKLGLNSPTKVLPTALWHPIF